MERTRTSANAGVYLVAGPLLALAIGWLGMDVWGLDWPSAAVAAVTAWCALWWLTEPVPIPVTSLLPMALLPLAGALTPGQVAASYGSPLILLLLGAFMLPVATAPNAVVYGSGRVTIAQMAREGIVINLIAAVVITLVVTLRFG